MITELLKPGDICIYNGASGNWREHGDIVEVVGEFRNGLYRECQGIVGLNEMPEPTYRGGWGYLYYNFELIRIGEI